MKRKLKYLKVYVGPAYPVDPKKQEVRNLDLWINSIERTLKYSRTGREIQYDRLNQYQFKRLN